VDRAIDKLLRRLIPSLYEHLTDDRIASLFCYELPFAERLIARQHLANCWRCRVRQEDLEGWRADRVLDVYRKIFEDDLRPLPSKPRAEFMSRLQVHIRDTRARRSRSLHLPHFSLTELPSMNPILANCMLLGLATAISFFFWWQQRVPSMSSNALLLRAERWDMPSHTTSSGVVFQSVRITTSKQTLERSIYRDLQGRRQLRPVRLAEKEEQLKKTLVLAGLDWNEPISASGYQGWHDSQHAREDKIVRAGRHLLTLTTKVPAGLIAEQSLTVRDTDFHPVRRTVAFRGSDAVEIAEVDFKILPWSAVDASVFEPVDSFSHAAAANPVRILPFPRMPEMLTEAQLDEAELSARLILNQFHADSGEQIEIHRSPRGVEVAGLVETEERMRTLRAELLTVPHLTVLIQNVLDLEGSDVLSETPMSVELVPMTDQPSPIETYLLARAHSVSSISLFEQRLFNAALTISRESQAISDLQSRFNPGVPKTVVASATLANLIYSHRERLIAELKQERELLVETQQATGEDLYEGLERAPETSSLVDAAARNLSLCKELTQTNAPATRTAETILAETAVSLKDINVHLHEVHWMLQGDSALSGKK
jgi:hypothetical protein